MITIDIADIYGVGKTYETEVETKKDVGSIVFFCGDTEKNIRITGDLNKIRDLLGQAIHTIDGE